MQEDDKRSNESEGSSKSNPSYLRPSARAFMSATGRQLGRLALGVSGNVKQFVKQDLKPGGDAKPPDVSMLKQVVNRSKEEIARVQTVFPFTLFPDDIILDRMKITICKRNFFWSADVISIRIEDVFNVSSSVGPLFGSVIISSRIMNSVDHFEINRLWRHDAIEVKTLIQGYMIAKHSNVELDDLSMPELIETLRELGGETGASLRHHTANKKP